MACFDNDLTPFFDSLAVIRGQTVKVCVYPGEYADPLASTANADAAAVTTTLLVLRLGEGAWNNPSDPPKAGDSIGVGDRSFVATSVDLFDTNYFTVKARSV